MRLKITPAPSEIMDRDRAFRIATRYVLDCPGIESRWGSNFPHPSSPALQPIPPTLKWVSLLFPGVNLPESGVAFTTHPI